MKQVLKEANFTRIGVIAVLLMLGQAILQQPAWGRGDRGDRGDGDDRSDKSEHREQSHNRDAREAAHEDRSRRDDGAAFRRDNRENRNHGREQFGDHHRTLVREYYSEHYRSGRCPPGLARKNNYCMPPGQERRWNVGYALPRDVIYYSVPPALVVQLGRPAYGYRYVRVAGDILLIALATGLVVDAIQN
jgi:Ni/Co efflux regulator RcnB